jgi:hypothetical protein
MRTKPVWTASGSAQALARMPLPTSTRIPAVRNCGLHWRLPSLPVENLLAGAGRTTIDLVLRLVIDPEMPS